MNVFKTAQSAAEQLEALTTYRKKLDDSATKARERVYKCMDQAQRAGLSYVEISEITGLSLARVGQVLKTLRSGKAIT